MKLPRIIVYLWIALLACSFYISVRTSYRQSLGTEEFAYACDSFGYLRMAKQLRHAYEHAVWPEFKLETGILAGALLLVAGIGLSIYALSFWSATSFGPLDPSRTLRLVIPAVTLIALGLQTVLSSFFLSILGLERH